MIELVNFDLSYLELSGRWLVDSEIKAMTAATEFTKKQQYDFFYSLDKRTDYIIFGVQLGAIKIGATGFKNICLDSAEYWGYIGEKEYWGMGYGYRMLSLMIDKARSMGLKFITLKVRQDNLRAISVYIKAGFYTVRSVDDFFSMKKDLL